MGKCCLLAVPHGQLSLFPYITRDHLSMHNTAGSGLDPHIYQQPRKCPTGLQRSQSDGDIFFFFSVEVSYSHSIKMFF